MRAAPRVTGSAPRSRCDHRIQADFNRSNNPVSIDFRDEGVGALRAIADATDTPIGFFSSVQPSRVRVLRLRRCLTLPQMN